MKSGVAKFNAKQILCSLSTSITKSYSASPVSSYLEK